MKERKPHQIVLYVELEDNVGYILGRRRVELSLTDDGIPADATHDEIATKFNDFVDGIAARLKI
jgi:hypothetical protein